MGSHASLKTSRTLWNCDRIGKSQSDLPKIVVLRNAAFSANVGELAFCSLMRMGHHIVTHVSLCFQVCWSHVVNVVSLCFQVC